MYCQSTKYFLVHGADVCLQNRFYTWKLLSCMCLIFASHFTRMGGGGGIWVVRKNSSWYKRSLVFIILKFLPLYLYWDFLWLICELVNQKSGSWIFDGFATIAGGGLVQVSYCSIQNDNIEFLHLKPKLKNNNSNSSKTLNSSI